MRKTRKSAKIMSAALAAMMAVSAGSVAMVASAALIPSYTPGAVYTGGMQCTYNGKVYEAKYWTDTVPGSDDSWKTVGDAPGGSTSGESVTQINIKPIPTGDKLYMGYAIAAEVATPAAFDTLRNYGPCSAFTIKQGEQFVMYMTEQKSSWYLGQYTDCLSLKLAGDQVEFYAAGYDWNGITTQSTNNYEVSYSSGAIEVRYAPNSTKDGSITVSQDEVDNTKYVSDTTLDEWAKMEHDLYTMHDDGGRQGMSVNSVKNLLDYFNAVPARSVSKEFQDSEVHKYYAEEKVKNAQYMKHETYEGSQYFMQDYYAQGVWDSMPATYGWQQDEYTTPGKVAMYRWPEYTGKAYAIAAGGQNPYILCDYLAREGSKVTDGTLANATAGSGNADGWFSGYDEVAEVAYVWNPDEGVFLGYESKESWEARAEYIHDKGLAGVIIWEISGDDKQAYEMTKIFGEELKAQGKEVIAYFCNWSVFNQYHQKQTPKDIPWDHLTMINYSFFQVGGWDTGSSEIPVSDLPANTLQSIDAWADDYTAIDAAATAPNMLLELEDAAANHPDVKVMLSVGGWTRGDGFGSMIETPAGRKTFINSVIAFMNKYPCFDGIDIDFEYPGVGTRLADPDDPGDMGCLNSSNDYVNYTAFITELKAALTANFGAQGRDTLTACFPAPTEKNTKQNLGVLSQQLDFMNMMTYDFHGAFDPTIGYNNPLFTPTDYQGVWSTDATVKGLEAAGVDLSRVNIGAGLYSRGWAGVIPDQDGNPAPLSDPTPIFNSTTVTPPTTKGLEYAMKLEATKAYKNGVLEDTNESIIQGNVYKAKLQLDKGKTFLPARSVAEAIGLEVGYDAATSYSTVTDGTKTVKIVPNSTNIIVVENGVSTTVNTGNAPIYVKGVIHIPVRAVIEQFGFFVNWHADGYLLVTDYELTSADAIQTLKDKVATLL